MLCVCCGSDCGHSFSQGNGSNERLGVKGELIRFLISFFQNHACVSQQHNTPHTPGGNFITSGTNLHLDLDELRVNGKQMTNGNGWSTDRRRREKITPLFSSLSLSSRHTNGISQLPSLPSQREKAVMNGQAGNHLFNKGGHTSKHERAPTTPHFENRSA